MELRRHGLVRLTVAGWRQAIEQHDDVLVRQSLVHWSSRDWPAVVTTQGRGGVHGAAVALGVATPPVWGLRRIPLRVAGTELRRDVDEFPLWSTCADTLALPERARAVLGNAFAMLGGTARVRELRLATAHRACLRETGLGPRSPARARRCPARGPALRGPVGGEHC